MSKEKLKLVMCPECGKAYYVKEKDIKTKNQCPYCENWVALK